jgi:hypothetical protein
MVTLEELMPPVYRRVSRRVMCLLPVLPLILLCTSCDGFFVSESSIQSVTVSPAAVILKAGASPADTYTLSSTSLTVGGTTTTDTTTAKWTSSNTAVVTSAADGVITAASTAGGNQTATITATDGGQSGTCKVLTYTGTAPTSLSLSYPAGDATPAVGAIFAVTATVTTVFNGVTDFNLSPYVTWTSSSTSVATVDVNGNVTVLSTATVGAQFTITATATFSGGTVVGTSNFTVA